MENEKGQVQSPELSTQERQRVLNPSTRLRTAKRNETPTGDGLSRALLPRSGFQQARSHFCKRFKAHWQGPRSCRPGSSENTASQLLKFQEKCAPVFLCEAEAVPGKHLQRGAL